MKDVDSGNGGMANGIGFMGAMEHDHEEEIEDQVLLILVGLPGSAKSTFSNALVAASSTAEWADIQTPEPTDTNVGKSSVEGTERPAEAWANVSKSKKLAMRRWTRVSQDEAPSRRRQECERQVVDALRRGDNVVVDRVNFDPT